LPTGLIQDLLLALSQKPMAVTGWLLLRGFEAMGVAAQRVVDSHEGPMASLTSLVGEEVLNALRGSCRPF